MCICLWACMHVYVCAHTCESPIAMSGILPQSLFTFIFRDTEPEARLGSQWTSWIHHFLPPCVCSGDLNSCPAFPAGTLPAEPSPHLSLETFRQESWVIFSLLWTLDNSSFMVKHLYQFNFFLNEVEYKTLKTKNKANVGVYYYLAIFFIYKMVWERCLSMGSVCCANLRIWVWNDLPQELQMG